MHGSKERHECTYIVVMDGLTKLKFLYVGFDTKREF